MTIYFQRLSVTSERQRWSKFGIQDALSCPLSFSIFALLKNGMEINKPDAITIIVSERHRTIPSCLFIFLLKIFISVLRDNIFLKRTPSQPGSLEIKKALLWKYSFCRISSGSKAVFKTYLNFISSIPFGFP